MEYERNIGDNIMAKEKSNTPQMVLDAVIDAPKKIGKIEIGDITILKYAYLEKLHSPFIDPTQEFTVESIAPAVFVLAKDKKELRKYGNDIETLKMDALEWIDENVSLEDVPEVIKTIVGKLTAVNKAAPAGSEQDNSSKKK